MLNDEKTNSLKTKFLTYFKQLPVQKLAAACIGRSEDTISLWKKEDSDFSEMLDRTKAEWVLKKVNQVKSAEWLLERVMKEHFSLRNEVISNNDQPFIIKMVSYDDAVKEKNSMVSKNAQT